MYEQHFGFRAKPFQLNPDPDFLFGSRGHKRAMAYLQYGLQQGEGFIVVTGEVGAGKTTLLRSLLGTLDDAAVVAAQIVSTQVDSEDLLRLVASAFGVPTEGADKSSLLIRLHALLETLHRDGRRALLVVDEAQNLPQRAVEELRMLSNFQVGTRSMLQSFLVGQPEFRSVMQRAEMRQLQQRVLASYHLGPLDMPETRQYIEHRLRHVGWRDDPTFAPDAFERIHQSTDGIPRRINLLCDRLLLAAYLSDAHVISALDVDAVFEELQSELGLPTVVSPRLAEQRALSMGTDAAVNGAFSAPTQHRSTATGDKESVIDRMAQLEERVDAVETSSRITLNLIKRILRILRSTTREPAPGDASTSADR